MEFGGIFGQIFQMQVLQTPRLILRGLETSDDKVIFQLRSSEEVNRYLERKPAKTIEDARAHMRRLFEGPDLFFWGLESRDEKKLIGTICLWNLERDKNIAEIGYELLPAYHGRGFMDEAIKAVVKYAFNIMKLDSITAWTHKENVASFRLLEKNGFTLSEEERGNIDPMLVYELKSK